MDAFDLLLEAVHQLLKLGEFGNSKQKRPLFFLILLRFLDIPDFFDSHMILVSCRQTPTRSRAYVKMKPIV